MQTTPHTQPVKKRRANKLVLGFAAVVASAVVGTTGFAAAADTLAASDKPSKAACAAAGFKNYGQCVKEWAKSKNRPGGGYGGNVSTNVNVNFNDNAHDNVVQVIIHNTINLFR